MKRRVHDEKGAVLVVVALVMTALLILSGGGIMLFTLYGSHREMQKAADQGALAGAAGLPLLNPSGTLDSLGLQQNYQLLEGVGLDTALSSAHNIPDPRAVACAYAKRNLDPDSASLTSKFGAGINAGGWCSIDPRVNVSLSSYTSGLSQCVSGLTASLGNLESQLTNGLNGLLGTVVALGYTVGDIVNNLGLLNLPIVGGVLRNALALLNISVEQVQNLIITVPQVIDQLDEVIKQVTTLEQLAPALLTPRVTVTVTERVSPPLMGLVTGGNGVQMTLTATAERRLKNVIVLPESQLLGVDLNTPLNATKGEVLGTLVAVNNQLNDAVNRLQLAGLGSLAGCQDLLSPASDLYAAVDDLYSPPDSAPYTGADLVEGANAAVIRLAGESGTTVDAVAGEAFLVIAQGGPNSATLSSLLGAGFRLLDLDDVLNLLPIPALDVGLVAAHHLENGNISNDQLIPDTLSARGLFTARLVN